MVEKHEVISAYRFMLGRDPENEAVIERRLGIRDWIALRELVLASPEYKAKQFLKPPERYTTAGAIDVEVSLSQDKYAQLLQHVKRVWEHVGSERPHWSVLTAPEYLPERIEENLEDFYASGAGFVRRLEAALSRAATALPAGCCLELGCGVGRVTAHLARHFDRVIGLDISAPHIALASSYFKKLKINNIETLILRDIDDLNMTGPIDVFYSTLVLQHNPPPLIFEMLDRVFGALRDGGLAFFQVPVFGHEYGFKIDEYLRALSNVDEQGMEMHVLPQRYIFSLFEKHNIKLVDIMDDGNAGNRFLSHQFLARKSGGSEA